MAYKTFTIIKIEKYLNTLKRMIKDNAKIILSNREKNMKFCEDNNIKVSDIKNILLNLNVYDFCKILKNRNLNSKEDLYLFAPIIKVKFNRYSQIYLKINRLIDKNVIILVSFHEPEYKLNTIYYDRSVYCE